ncbi:hypothetical protein LINPERPRIM_LOCUS5890 [Linum perenne]
MNKKREQDKGKPLPQAAGRRSFSSSTPSLHLAAAADADPSRCSGRSTSLPSDRDRRRSLSSRSRRAVVTATATVPPSKSSDPPSRSLRRRRRVARPMDKRTCSDCRRLFRSDATAGPGLVLRCFYLEDKKMISDWMIIGVQQPKIELKDKS